MSRRLDRGERLVIASHNPGKIDEIAALLRPFGVETIGAAALGLPWPDGEIALFRAEVHGRLTWPPRGERGFGYDPIFVPDGYEMTFGELDAAKRRISHRARAFEKLVAACF